MHTGELAAAPDLPQSSEGSLAEHSVHLEGRAAVPSPGLDELDKPFPETLDLLGMLALPGLEPAHLQWSQVTGQ